MILPPMATLTDAPTRAQRRNRLSGQDEALWGGAAGSARGRSAGADIAGRAYGDRKCRRALVVCGSRLTCRPEWTWTWNPPAEASLVRHQIK